MDYHKTKQKMEETMEKVLMRSESGISRFQLIYELKKQFAVGEFTINKHLRLLEEIGKVEIQNNDIKWKA